MSRCFCTIITANYLHFALALNDSLLKFGQDKLYILIVDSAVDINSIEYSNKSNLNLLHINELEVLPVAGEIIRKYKIKNVDCLRWALKPCLISSLLEIHTKVIFLDCDLYFLSNYNFLFDYLNNYNILLTPHWRNIKPDINDERELTNFDLLFTHGLFNAGFIGCNSDAKTFLDWWSLACLKNTDIDLEKGLYVDQKYLDLVPMYFDKVKIINHKGCNVSEWNQSVCQRSIDENGILTINKEYPVVFIHFIRYYENIFNNGKDLLVKPYYEKWKLNIDKYKHISETFNSSSVNQTKERLDQSLISKLFKKTRLRKRFIAFYKG